MMRRTPFPRLAALPPRAVLVQCNSTHLEIMELRVLERMPLPFDVYFFVAKRLREVKREEKARAAEGDMCVPACAPLFCSLALCARLPLPPGNGQGIVSRTCPPPP